MAADGRAVERARRHFAQGGGERLDGAVLDEHAGDTVDHAFDCSSFRQGHDRPSARLSLYRHHAEILDPRHQDGAAALVESPNLFVREPASELYVGSL